MKLNGWIIIILAFFTSLKIYGQDTVSVYFEFGQSKLADNQLEKINAIQTDYDLSDLDSVYFIGSADSVGNLKSNFELSEKRAKNVAKYSFQFFPKNIHYKIIALGEGYDLDTKQNRRVDIMMYFQPAQTEIFIPLDSIQPKKCFNVDYKLLSYCNISTTNNRNKEMVIIETTLPDVMKENEHFFGSTVGDNFVATKVKWTTKKTGDLWWAKTRYVTTISKEDFEKYKIFKIKDLPCDSCSEHFESQAKISKEIICIKIDRYLMENMQFNIKFFDNTSVKIRVPRAYVNIDDTYYMGCNFKNKLIWETHKDKSYYYATVPRSLKYIHNIMRVMECCKNKRESTGCENYEMCCSTSPFKQGKSSSILNAEIGSYYQQSTITPYAGFGVTKEGSHSRFNFLLGTDINPSFISAITYQYHFISFPFSAINPTIGWQRPIGNKYTKRYGRLYLGSEIKTRINENALNYLEQNIHLGLAAVNVKDDAFIPRIFIQYGIGFDYLSNNSSKIYPIFQIGLNMKIAKLDF